MSPARQGSQQASFYLCENFDGKGVRVVLLVESKWTAYLKGRAGFPASPFFSRPRRDSEPETHPNGHPWAWLYTPEDALKDEARQLPPADFEEFREALEGAVEDARSRLKDQAGAEKTARELDEISV